MDLTQNEGASLGRHILLIEDNQEIAEVVNADLRGRGYEVCHAATGSAGLASIRLEPFDLFILDRMLPEIDGLSILEVLRKECGSTPVLIISALGDVDERIRGLEAGADDYLTKPFSLAEMGARVEALLRRPLKERATTLKAGPLSLDLLERVARLDGEVIELSTRISAARIFRLSTWASLANAITSFGNTRIMTPSASMSSATVIRMKRKAASRDLLGTKSISARALQERPDLRAFSRMQIVRAKRSPGALRAGALDLYEQNQIRRFAAHAGGLRPCS